MKNAPKVTMWYLPRDVDYEAWNVRSNHRLPEWWTRQSRDLFVSDTYESRNGEKWLKVVQISKRSCREGWAHNSEAYCVRSEIFNTTRSLASTTLFLNSCITTVGTFELHRESDLASFKYARVNLFCDKTCSTWQRNG